MIDQKLIRELSDAKRALEAATARRKTADDMALDARRVEVRAKERVGKAMEAIGEAA